MQTYMNKTCNKSTLGIFIMQKMSHHTSSHQEILAFLWWNTLISIIIILNETLRCPTAIILQTPSFRICPSLGNQLANRPINQSKSTNQPINPPPSIISLLLLLILQHLITRWWSRWSQWHRQSKAKSPEAKRGVSKRWKTERRNHLSSMNGRKRDPTIFLSYQFAICFFLIFFSGFYLLVLFLFFFAEKTTSRDRNILTFIWQLFFTLEVKYQKIAPCLGDLSARREHALRLNLDWYW